VFRSGVPSVFVPHTADQFVWAVLAESAGLSGPALAFQQLTAGSLADSIKRTLENSSYRQKAAEMRMKIHAENGVRKARLLIDDLLHKLGLYQHEPDEAVQDTHLLAEKIARRKEHQKRQRLKNEPHS
jgi:hypothetical protein